MQFRTLLDQIWPPHSERRKHAICPTGSIYAMKRAMLEEIQARENEAIAEPPHKYQR